MPNRMLTMNDLERAVGQYRNDQMMPQETLAQTAPPPVGVLPAVCDDLQRAVEALHKQLDSIEQRVGKLIEPRPADPSKVEEMPQNSGTIEGQLRVTLHAALQVRSRLLSLMSTLTEAI